jgi:hypothetical protein
VVRTRLLRVHVLVAATAITVAWATAASAQPRRGPAGPPRVTIGVSGGVQAGATTLSEHFSVPRDQETESVDVTYPARVGTLVDVGASVRVWKRLGLGVAVSRATSTGSAEVDASVPHPFQFNQPRMIHGTESGVVHAETGVHLQVQYLVPASSSVHVVLSAGPSWLNVEQETVIDLTVSQSYPYDTAAFGGAVTKILKKSGQGFHAGFDITWMFSRSAGLGGLVRYTRADADLDVAEGRTLAVKAGGVQGGAGLRIRF